MDYYTEIEALEKALNVNDKNVDQLAALQAKLNELMAQFRGDESLGTNRYALYQVQAMLSFRLRDYDKAKRFIDYAVVLKGEDFEAARQLNQQLFQQDFTPKKLKKWWMLIIAPWCGLVLVALLQLIVHLVLAKSTSISTESPAQAVVNILSILVGTVSVIGAACLPIWIVELVYAKNYNKGHGYTRGLRKSTGVIIAVFLAYWYWLYTYKVSKTKFWVNFIVGFTGYWVFVAWIWAIIEAAVRPDEFYTLYPYAKDLPPLSKK